MTEGTKPTTTYVVQLERGALTDVVEGREVTVTPTWQDIATVEVPAGSKAKTIIGLAIAESGVKPEVGGEPLRLRALDVRSAHVTVVVAKAVDPTLEWS